jgi:Flp pilus assembly pilin Flp
VEIRGTKKMKKGPLLSRQTGATAVEFAVILLLLLVLIFGVIEFGLFLFNRQVINNAVREAARAGIVVRIPRLSDAEIDTIGRNFCEQYLVTFGSGSLDIPLPLLREDPGGNPLGLDSDGNPILGHFGDVLTVRATYPYDWLFLSNLGIGSKTIQSISRMRME